jgi:hypothetical protein
MKKIVMRFLNWQYVVGLALITLSAAIYFIHSKIFGDFRITMNYMLGNIAFLPIEALIVTLVLHRLLTQREKAARLQKLNMVIGTFFSEAGNWQLAYFSDIDPDNDKMKTHLCINSKWTDNDFSAAAKKLKEYSFKIDQKKLDLLKLKGFVMSKRDFLLGLLENPNLLEHESFTELLLAYFHLIEELAARTVISPLKENDLKHITGDSNRVYVLLAAQWIEYMKHLGRNYPYLFSLAIRTNPFDKEATVEIS